MINFLKKLLINLTGLFFSKTTKDTTLIFLGNVASAALGISISIVAARTLGPEDWGIVAAVISGVAILTSFSDLGFGSSIFRYVSKSFYNHKFQEAALVLKTIFSIRVITAILFFLFLIIFSPIISPIVFKISDFRLVIIAAFGFFSALILDFQIATIESKQNFKVAAFLIVLSNFFRFLMLLILSIYGTLNIANTLGVYFGSTFVTLLISTLLQPLYFGFSKNFRKLLKEVVAFSGWMGLNRGVNALGSRIDIILILQFMSPYQAGIYAAAKHLANGVPIILGSFATVLAPKFTTFEEENLQAFLKKSILLSFLVSLFIFLGIFIASPVISLFGSKYSESTYVFQGLLVAMIPYALSTPAVNYLIYSLHKPKIITFLSLAQLPFMIYGTVLLMPNFGVLSPVIILGLVNISTLLITYLYIWTYKK